VEAIKDAPVDSDPGSQVGNLPGTPS